MATAYSNVFEIEEPSTGKKYRVEGVDGTTREEAIAYLGSLSEDEIAAKEIKQAVAPTQGAAPVGVTNVPAAPRIKLPEPTIDRQQIETAIVQGGTTDAQKADPRFLGPEGEAEYLARIADPNNTVESLNAWLREQAQAKGAVVSENASGFSEDSLAQYRKTISNPNVQQAGVSYSNVIDNAINQQTEETQPVESPGFFDSLVRSYQNAAQYGTPGFIARTYQDWMDTGSDQLRKMFPDATDEQIEEMQTNLVMQSQRALREQGAKLAENDPIVPWLIGEVLGGSGVEDIVPFASATGLAKRLGTAAAVNSATDTGYQALDVAQGVQDDFSVEQAALAPVLGAGLAGTVEGVSRAVGAIRADGKPVNVAPSQPIPTTVGTRQGSTKYAEALTASTDAVTAHVDNLTSGWTNAPKRVVHERFDEVEGADNDAIGFMAGDGTVHLNTKAILKEAKDSGKTPEEITNAVMFHEGLGHFGLLQKFGEQLDNELAKMLDASPVFQRRVQKWLNDNPDAYADAPNRDLLAFEELLAERSEAGKLPASFVNRAANMIKDLGRSMGLDLKYSVREIETILGMAHNAVVNGKGRDVAGNGFKYMQGTNTVSTRYMEDGTSVEVLTDLNGNILDTMNYRSPQGNMLPDEYKPSVKEVRALADKELEDFEAYVNQAVEEDLPELGGYDTWQAVKLMEDADANPGKLQVMRMWPKDQSIVDFRYVDPQTKTPVYGAFRKRGNKATEFEVYGGGRNTSGVKSIREIRRQLKEAFPDIDTVEATRISGARHGGQEVSVYEGTEMRNRFMRPRNGGKLRFTPEEIAEMSPDELLESRDALNILNAMTEGYEPVVMSLDDLRYEAETRGVPLSKLKGIEPGELTRRLFMHEIAADKMNEQVTSLYAKINSGNFTRADQVKYIETIAKFNKLTEQIFRLQGEAGRVLRAVQELQYTARQIGGMKQTLQEFGGDNPFTMLEDPDTFLKFAKAIQEQIEEQKASKKTDRLNEGVANALNLPRALMSSADLSAALRQGIFLIGRKEWWKAFPQMFRYFGSERAFKELNEEILTRDTYPLMRDAKLALTSPDGKLSSKEEDFQTQWAQKIPAIGKMVRMSERAYSGFLNKLRADTFDTLIRGLGDEPSPDALRQVAHYINSATGRGDLPNNAFGTNIEAAAPVLNALFFSPRLIASRLDLLSKPFRPSFYVNAPSVVRKAYIRDLMSLGAIASTVATLAAMAGADIETDPRSSDFAKIKVGNTRYDILGGFGQYITLGARLQQGKYKNSEGDIKEYGKGYRANTELDAITTFARNKAAPLPAYIANFFDGQNTIGEKFDPVKDTRNLFIPMFAQDAVEVMTEDQFGTAASKLVPALFGVGVQTYSAQLDENEEQEAPESYTVDGEEVVLDEETRAEWKRVKNFYIKEWMKYEMTKPEWKTMTDKQRNEIIRSVRTDANKEAKAYILEMTEGPEDE